MPASVDACRRLPPERSGVLIRSRPISLLTESSQTRCASSARMSAPLPRLRTHVLSRMDDRDAHPRPPVGKIFRCRQIGGKRPKTGRSCGLFAPRGEIWRAGVGRLRKKAYFCLLLNGGTESRQTGTEPVRSCSPCGARLPGRTPGNRSGEVRFFHPLRLSDRFSR